MVKFWQNSVFHTQFTTKKVNFNLDLMQNVLFFLKKWLIFGKTQLLTQNGVKPSKTLLSIQHNEKSSLEQGLRSFSTYS